MPLTKKLRISHLNRIPDTLKPSARFLPKFAFLVVHPYAYLPFTFFLLHYFRVLSKLDPLKEIKVFLTRHVHRAHVILDDIHCDLTVLRNHSSPLCTRKSQDVV